MNVGDLVVIDAVPGVGRIERFLDVDGVPSARVLLYVDGTFVVHALSRIKPCPPGTRAAP